MACLGISMSTIWRANGGACYALGVTMSLCQLGGTRRYYSLVLACTVPKGSFQAV